MTINKDKNIDRFKKMWQTLDEDEREILAGALYVLNQPRGGVGILEAHRVTKFVLTEENKALLTQLAEYTAEN